MALAKSAHLLALHDITLNGIYELHFIKVIWYPKSPFDKYIVDS